MKLTAIRQDGMAGATFGFMKSQRGQKSSAFFSTDSVNGVKKGNEAEFAEKYPLRILLAEDDYVCRRVMVMFLQRLGYEPTCVENGLECLNEAMDRPYDLILTDIEMPEMSGAECTSELRKAGVDAFIVAVTSSDTRAYSLSVGMNEYLAKPFDGMRLKNILQEAFHFQGINHAVVA